MQKAPRRSHEPEVGYILLTARAVREDNQFVSSCDDLGVASCGDTVEEALENLLDAVDVYLRGLEETGELNRVLRELNIRVDDIDDPPHRYRIPVDPAESMGANAPMYQFHRRQVPVPV